MEDCLSLRPMFNWTKARVRGHVALCVLAATIEAVMAQVLVTRSWPIQSWPCSR
ncbi:MAG: hypothetical protein ACLQCU_10490 [Acidimicrobiales bacterium]